MKTKTTLLIAIIFALFASFARADRVDEYINQTLKKQKIPGLALAILRDGKPVKMQGYGLANIEHGATVKPETIFQSGSMGKQFTAAAIMLLQQEGKLQLDDAITKYFPKAPAFWKRITVRHLLTHTSGIPDYTSKNVDFRKDYTEEDLLKVLMSLKPQFRPGEKWSYSNSGYMLLGFLIRKVSGRFYGDFLEERVFGPLGMTATSVISEEDIVANRASGYELNKEGEIKNQSWVAPSLNTTADGALYFNVVDLAKWDAALNGFELLNETSKELMWTPVELKSGVPYPYGFGWAFGYQRGSRIIQHGGHWQGFSTGICRYVDSKLTVTVLTNLSDVDAVSIAHAVAGLHEPALLAPRFMSPSAQPDSTLNERLKRALADYASGAKSTAWGPGFLSVAEKEEREEVAKMLKGLQSFDLLDCDDVSQAEAFGEKVSRFCYYKINSEGKIHYATFGLTSDNRVATFSVEEDK